MPQGIYACAGDPMTDGHVYVINEAAAMFEELTLAISNDASKVYMFTLDERLEMAKQIVEREGLENVQVEVIENQFVADYAYSQGIPYVVRSIRNERDFTAEKEMWNASKNVWDSLRVVPIFSPKHLEGATSSFVKKMIGPKGWRHMVEQYVPGVTMEALLQKFAKEKKVEAKV